MATVPVRLYWYEKQLAIQRWFPENSSQVTATSDRRVLTNEAKRLESWSPQAATQNLESRSVVNGHTCNVPTVVG